MSFSGTDTVRYYNMTDEHGRNIQSCATIDDIVNYLVYETLTEAGGCVHFHRCSKNGTPLKNSRDWYFDLNLDLRTPESEQADCYWYKWPYTEITTPDYLSGQQIEKCIKA